MSTTTSGQISGGGRIILSLEDLPWHVLYRAVIGYFLVPAYGRLFGGQASAWKLVALFLLLLAALRVVPGILRRLLPFSPAVKMVWAERRALARRYDSYQWRKLFGLGLGCSIYLIRSGQAHGTALFLAAGCIVGGTLGLICWHSRRKFPPGQVTPSAVTPA